MAPGPERRIMWAGHGSIAGRHAALCGVGGRGPVVPLVPVAGLWATVVPAW